MAPDCLVCDEISGGIAVPGGAVYSSLSSLVVHVPPINGGDVFLGHLLVVPRRHVADFAGLDDDEAADIGVSIHVGSRTLKDAGATSVYVATIGHSVEHLHVHLLPRWPETPAEIPWHSVDDWSGARRATFDEAATFVTQLMQR
jgi:diadenosine tetraphosphate (Ap4A) HIT family hydrolase